MKTSDNNIYPSEDVKLSRFAKALGHPVRIAILRYLASLETCRFTEISGEFNLANSTISQHLAELKRAGLIQGSIEPPKLQYCINFENWELMRKHFKEFAEIKVVKYEGKEEERMGRLGEGEKGRKEEKKKRRRGDGAKE